MNLPTYPSDSAAVVKLVHWTESRLRDLKPGERYCLHQILAMTTWDAEDPLYTEQARRFARLIIIDRLPFVIAGTHGRSQNLYRYTPERRIAGGYDSIQDKEEEY